MYRMGQLHVVHAGRASSTIPATLSYAGLIKTHRVKVALKVVRLLVQRLVPVGLMGLSRKSNEKATHETSEWIRRRLKTHMLVHA